MKAKPAPTTQNSKLSPSPMPYSQDLLLFSEKDVCLDPSWGTLRIAISHQAAAK